jgi:hypothetical protein
MESKTYKLLFATIALAAVCSAHALTYGDGSAYDQLDILSIGPNVGYYAEIGGFFEPILTGTGSAGCSSSTNGTDSFNTNSYNEVYSGTGTAYQESVEGEELFFTNTGPVDESVTVSWVADVASTSYNSTPGAYSWDVSESYLQIGYSVFISDEVETATYSTPSASQYEQDTETFIVPAGTLADHPLELSTDAYSEGYSAATAPGPAAVAPFAVSLIGLVSKRRRRQS